jgi:hypothetical protein
MSDRDNDNNNNNNNIQFFQQLFLAEEEFNAALETDVIDLATIALAIC